MKLEDEVFTSGVCRILNRDDILNYSKQTIMKYDSLYKTEYDNIFKSLDNLYYNSENKFVIPYFDELSKIFQDISPLKYINSIKQNEILEFYFKTSTFNGYLNTIKYNIKDNIYKYLNKLNVVLYFEFSELINKSKFDYKQMKYTNKYINNSSKIFIY